MTGYTVEFAAVAERHARLIAAWWDANRPAAPDLFLDELAGAIEQISHAPMSGSPYSAPRLAGIRRLLLRRTGYHVYYSVAEGTRTVTVRAIWHAARGRAPRLD